jgi:hypothetical protein
LVSIWINQFLAIRIEPAPLGRRRALLTLGIAVNLLGLGYYKYGTFIWQLSENLADTIGFVRVPAAASIPLPIGISFSPFKLFPISWTYIGKKFLPPALTASSLPIIRCSRSW